MTTFCQPVFSEQVQAWVCETCKKAFRGSHPPKNYPCVSGQSPDAAKRVQPASGRGAALRSPAAPPVRHDCLHRGELIRRQGCKPCQAQGHKEIEVFTCAKHGECTLRNTSIQPRLKACATCQQYQSAVYQIVPAQGGPWAWRGISEPKPWEYQITAVIPVIQPDETLPLVIELLRLQTQRPYILLIDTGSDKQHADYLEAHRASDVEIHYLKTHGTVHLAECVSMACDFGATRAQTRFTFFTHSDCFLTRRTALSDAMHLAEKHIVAGHQITEREYEGWQREVGHTFLMCDQNELDRRGITWKMRRGILTPGALPAGITDYTAENLPKHIVDTERSFNRLLQAAGIVPYITGTEKNWQRNTDTWIDHVRSLAAAKLYSDEYYAEARKWLPEALQDARARIEEWGFFVLKNPPGGGAAP